MTMIVETTNQVNSIFQSSTDSQELYRILQEGRLNVSPALADEILRKTNYEHQRRIRPYQVELLVDKLSNGNWMPGSQIAFGRLRGRLNLVNGQHRMSAIIKAGRTAECQILIIPVASEEELAALYYKFDVVGSKRTTADVLRTIRVAEKHGITDGMATATYKAVALIMHNLRPPHYYKDPVLARDIDTRLEAAEDWWPIASQYEFAIESAPGDVRARLRRAGTAAVGLITLRYQPLKAFDFWNGIAENDGLRRGDPRSALLKDLFSRTLNSGITIQPQVAASLAWNAFFAGRSLKLIKVFNNSAIRVEGTPFKEPRR